MTRKFVLYLAAVSTLILTGYFIYTFEFSTWDFRNNLWAPAYLLVHGESPYQIRVLFGNSNALWFPQIIGIFFPLGFLPLYQASNLWLLINVSTIICTTAILVQKSNLKTLPFSIYGTIFLSVFLFPPTATYIQLGQVDFLLMAALLISVREINKQNAKTAALGFAIALAKPQVCFVVIPSVFLWLILNRKWKLVLELFVYLLIVILVLTLPLWFADWNWLADLIKNLHSNLNWSQPNLFIQLQILFGRNGLILWSAIAVTCMIISLILWSRLGPRRAVLWSMALTTIAAPYLWSWDFTLLLPLFVYTFARVVNWQARLVLLGTWLTCFFFSIWTRQIEWSDQRLWWLPSTMMLGIVMALLVEQRAVQKSQSLAASTLHDQQML